MLTAQNLFFQYGKTPVLKDINLEIRQGELLSIVGPNATGKTTLLKCVTRIIRPKQGRIFIDGKNASQMTRRALARHMGYVPQHFPARFPITVFDAVLMGRRPYIGWRPSAKDMDIVADIIQTMDLNEIALTDFDRLSGGQKQKVLLARAMAQDARYLLLDEPTSNLDLKHQMEVMEMIAEMVEQKNAGAIMAMHDLNLASRYSHKMLMLYKGKIFCAGTPQEVLTSQNILCVYGVNATISTDNGCPYIVLKRPVRRNNINKQGDRK